jgi:hypothetical protein
MDILNKDIFTEDSPNIIFYGSNLNLDDYFISVFSECNTITHGNIIYQNSPYCKIFDIHEIKSKDSDNFLEYLKTIISSINYYSKYKQHIIIFNNYTLASLSLQSKLRVVIEKYRKTTQFIFVTNTLNTIINPIKSRCLCIRIPTPDNKEKRQIAKEYLKNKSYKEKIPIYDCIYSLTDKDEIKMYSKRNDYLHVHEDIYLKIYQKINEWLNKNIKLDEIKDYSYNILKNNINDIHKKLCEYYIIDPKYTARQKFKIIKCLTECEYEFKKSYRSLVHIEKMFIQLIYLLA